LQKLYYQHDDRWGALLHKLLELEVWNTTPLLIGGYDTLAYSKEGLHNEELRTQSIKGLWRWWLRAYLAGKYFVGDYRDVETLVRKEEGTILGSARDGEAHSSRLALRFTSMDSPLYDDAATLRNLPRVGLLTLGGRQLNYIKSIRGRLSVWLHTFKEARLEKDKVRIAILSLASALIFTGIGKGGRRGLGCLDFKILEDEVNLSAILSGGISPETLRRLVRETSTIREAKKLDRLPQIPAIAPNAFKLFYIPIGGKRPEELLRDLQDFTLRSRRDRLLGGDPFRRELKAWILGLPREVKRTGYEVDEVQRRASPLIFSIHKTFATVCLFKSTDWPRTIRWKSTPQAKPHTIDVERELHEAYQLLESTFLDHMGRLGYHVQEVKVW